MGCDIHMFAEYKTKPSSMTVYDSKGRHEETIEPFWMKIGKEFLNLYYDPTIPIDDYNEIHTDQPYHDRNYILFAFLADVRNYREIKPIAMPKGLPEDVSDEIKEESDDWGSDGHSHSYFTLEELENADWNQIVSLEAHLIKKDYELFKKINRPPNNSLEHYFEDRPYEVKWSEFIYEKCLDFLEALRPLKKRVNFNKEEYKNIRLVFWFDN